jgi:hypothetical protein
MVPAVLKIKKQYAWLTENAVKITLKILIHKQIKIRMVILDTED